MGVPALFRWLSQKYPKIVSQVIEERPREIDGQTIPVDTRAPNPNGEEFDNLYLDMNGIVHPCSHPENGPTPKNEEEMMMAIFKYTDRVVNMVRPRKLLMIAIDGVAPRAKMNQQRSRRFRSAQEAKEKAEDKLEFLKILKSKGGFNEETEVKKVWDSNEITPGTPFMDILAASLRYWISYKLNTDLAWAQMKIIISDSTVPGEGEHKIMEFIRSQRSSPEYNPNTKHVMYGLDADLIMLGLGTHEPHFRVLREDVFAQESKQRLCRLCNQAGHEARECQGLAKIKDGEFDEKSSIPPLKPFIWLHVSILREYLAAELHVPGQPFKFDLERAIDDWVFMCFFVGNDFLPHLPSLEIRENGIDTLIAIWRDNLPLMGGYLTRDGQVDLGRAQLILSGLAKQEDAIFRKRKQIEDRREANSKRRKMQQERGSRDEHGSNFNNQAFIQNNGYNTNYSNGSPTALPIFAPCDISKEAKDSVYDSVINRSAIFKSSIANKSAAAALKDKMNGMVSVKDENTAGSPQTPSLKRKASVLEDQNKSAQENVSQPNVTQTTNFVPQSDTVRLWEAGYVERYYEQKFGVDPQDVEFRHKVARAYVEGLSWVLLYYFQGCPSWDWYYPYHYAPFAADFVDISSIDISFEKGQIFRPFEQLMGVLPAGSRQAIPKEFHHLMISPESEIIDFYPEDFTVDLNGKKWAWQGVALLPFIDSKRLLDAMAKIYPELPPDVMARNGVGKDVLLFAESHRSLYDVVAKNFYSKKQGPTHFQLNPRISHGLTGEVEKHDTHIPHSTLNFPLSGDSFPNLDDDRSMTVHYEIPKLRFTHKSMLLRGVVIPPPVLTQTEMDVTREKAAKSGRSYGGAPLAVDSRGRNNFNYEPLDHYNSRINSCHNQRSIPSNYGSSLGGHQFGMPPQGWQPPPPGLNRFSSGPPQLGGYKDYSKGYTFYPPQLPYNNSPNSGDLSYNASTIGHRVTENLQGEKTVSKHYDSYRRL